jgi:molybdopterin-containing oxidoreductase family membrane subunit
VSELSGAPSIPESQDRANTPHWNAVTHRITSIVLTRPVTWGWAAGIGITLLGIMMLGIAITYLFIRGVGIWGINIPVAWGFAITNFVWWIGIGHAGTLISAILLLLKQNWRTSINRFAEAMTLFAVACAGLFPLLHLGRTKFFYWILPYPSTMGIWPQFRSPLVWDVFAVLTYATVSLLFWYIGMIPDLATMRDRAQSRGKYLAYAILALGWRGSARQWQRYEIIYLLLAGLATPLVVSVHTVVSWDFSVAILPGWHSTIFPPYFVAGAIYSGFAMVLTLAIPIRKFYCLEDYISIRHLENMAKVLLVTGLIVSYGYTIEMFLIWYGGDRYEQALTIARFTGPYKYLYWLLLFCNVISVQILWWKRARRCVPLLFAISIIVQTGMWLERFLIVVGSLHKGFMQSRWGIFHPTIWDWATLFGTVALFFALMLLFLRLLPAISMSEMRKDMYESAAR